MVPVITGGTGLYFRALEKGLAPVPEIPDDIREKWRGFAGDLHAELWTQTKDLIRQTADTETRALFIESINELIELHTTRLTAGVSRVPETIILVLMMGAVLTLGVMGYSAGLTARRGILSALVLMAALGTILTLVIDLDRPRDGFLRISQQPLIDLREELGNPPP